ncbi:hypothetical protein Hanom_Chr16g01517321 [Helianthus anomalus]
MSAGRKVDLPSKGSVRKFTGASFLAEIPARLRTLHNTSLTKSCRYLNKKQLKQEIRNLHICGVD